MTSTPIPRYSYSTREDKQRKTDHMISFKQHLSTKPLITTSFQKSIDSSSQSYSSYGLIDLSLNSLNFQPIPRTPVSISPFSLLKAQKKQKLHFLSKETIAQMTPDFQKENLQNSDRFYSKFHSKSQIINRIKQEMEAHKKKKQSLVEKIHKVSMNMNSFETVRRICTVRKNLIEKQNENKNITKATSRKLKIQDFKKISEIGEGEFSKVYLVLQKATNWLYTLKIINKNKAQIQSIVKEIKLQLWVQHPNIVTSYGFFGDVENIYIIQEYCFNGPLSIPTSLKDKQTVIAHVFEGVTFLHSQGILHRDIKLQNIVSVFNVNKICDFGFSVFASGQTRSTFCGTPNFISPEVIQGLRYNEKNDVWALGILTYLIFYGRVPFPVIREEDMLNIVSEELRFPFLNVQMQPVIRAMLQKDVESRPTMNVVMAMPAIQNCLKINYPKRFHQ